MDAKLKHLEFIQAVIGRMSTSAFLFKGWAVTLAAALSGFGAVRSKPALLLMSAASALLFWGLDGYYLWLERRFRDLYKRVAGMDVSAINFDMTIDKSRAFTGWMRICICSLHLVAFYGLILAFSILGTLTVRSK